MTDNNRISIRSLQHYLYCPHRWGLIEINNAWQENYFVVKANLLHERVHSSSAYTSRESKVYTSVSVWDDELGIYGVTDCIEEKNGRLCIVEYKPKKPSDREYREEDAVQVFAQKICVEKIFGKPCDTAFYYADVKRRVKLSLDERYDEYINLIKRLLCEMHEYLDNGVIPPIKKGQYCGGCSIADICMPKHGKTDIREQLFRLVEDDI